MSTSFIRAVAATLLVVSLAACNTSVPAKAPTTDVNPITGSRGGSGSR
jgi:hypothetical protein